MLKLFKREKGAELTVNDSVKTVRYSVSDESIQNILEMIHEFQSVYDGDTFGGCNFRDREVSQMSDYLMGIAATLRDPRELETIASFLNRVNSNLSMYIEMTEVEGVE